MCFHHAREMAGLDAAQGQFGWGALGVLGNPGPVVQKPSVLTAKPRLPTV